MVEQTLRYIRILDCKQSLHIAEIGTGSGCVAISIAKYISSNHKGQKKIQIYATDISTAAIKIAKLNASRHKVLSKIKFLHGNLLEPLKNKKLDIIIANLPYLNADLKNLTNSSFSKSLRYEPSISLKGGKDGLSIYRNFFQQAAKLKHLPKYILTEIAHKQTKPLSAFIKKILPQGKIQVLKDLNNKDRVIVVTI